jgi:hypothetical protein
VGVTTKWWGYHRVCSATEDGPVAWIVRLVQIGADGEERCADVMKVDRPDDLADIADLGLTLAEATRVVAGLQQEIVAAQARSHAVRLPDCRRCSGVRHVKDHREHAVAMPFGQVTVRLPRFHCATCGGIEAGIRWPLRGRSTPERDQFQAHLSGPMTYRTAADVLEQMFPVDAGRDAETLRRRTLKIGEALRNDTAARPATMASAIVVTLDSTFIRSCEDGGRHWEVRIGNVETESSGRQFFGAVAKSDTDIKVLIGRSLDAVGRTEDTVLTEFTDGCSGRFCCILELPVQSGRNRGMTGPRRSPQVRQDQAFKGRQFTGEVILWAVRWDLMFPISYRDLELMLMDRGVEVDHTTIFGWV